jgi:flagellar hook-associated protein 1 FlgK
MNRREQVSGVSLDEEMTDLIRFQRAYEAAAHFANVVNDLLGTLIEQLGR